MREPRSPAPRTGEPDRTAGPWTELGAAVVKWAMAQNVLGEELEPCNLTR